MGGLRKLRRDQDRKYASSIVKMASRYGRKLSEVLLEFAEPLTATARTAEDFRKDIELAVLVWNLSLMPEEERSAFLKEAIDPSPGQKASLPPEIKPYIQMLLDRKQARFPDDNRFVVEHQLSGGPRDANLVVAYEIANR
ncbi:MAG: hypothetical protein ABFE13_11140 [Phycisphaerales bacterium]